MRYGRHALGSFKTNDSSLACLETIKRTMFLAAEKGDFDVVGETDFKFEGGGSGVSVVLLLSESHMSIHTWPEDGHVTYDCYTCGSTDPRAVTSELHRLLEAYEIEETFISRR